MIIIDQRRGHRQCIGPDRGRFGGQCLIMCLLKLLYGIVWRYICQHLSERHDFLAYQ